MLLHGLLLKKSGYDSKPRWHPDAVVVGGGVHLITAADSPPSLSLGPLALLARLAAELLVVRRPKVLTPLEAEHRYEAFVAEVGRTGVLWGLFKDGGWANWSDVEGKTVPFWPEQSAAQDAAATTFSGYEPRQVSLSDFLQDLLPQLEEQDFMIGMNPAPDMAGIDISCTEFATLLGRPDA